MNTTTKLKHETQSTIILLLFIRILFLIPIDIYALLDDGMGHTRSNVRNIWNHEYTMVFKTTVRLFIGLLSDMWLPSQTIHGHWWLPIIHYVDTPTILPS